MTRIVIIGDTLLDIDLDGSADRLSPDAPIPVVRDVDERGRAGGAGLAASLTPDDVDVTLVTGLAQDDHGERIRKLLPERVRVLSLPVIGETVRKTRVRASLQPVVRIDFGDAVTDPHAEITPELIATLDAADAVLVSDYGRGTAAHPALRDLLTQTASRVPVVWDPHPSGPPPIRGVLLATPNRREARQFLPEPGPSPAADAAELSRLWKAVGVAVTLGEEGAVLSVGSGVATLLPVPEIASSPGVRPDPCGAGDCFAVTAAVELARGALLSDAVAAAVRGASVFVAAGGVCRMDEVVELPTSTDPWKLMEAVRARGGRIVATGGCFDLLHAGHVELLRQARSLGDCLVVCLNSDDSVRALKGPGRPVVDERDRARVLSGLDSVDAVVVFEEQTPEQLIERIRPDLWVKGGDYASGATELPEADTVRRCGGEVVLLPYLDGRSTTGLVERAMARGRS